MKGKSKKRRVEPSLPIAFDPKFRGPLFLALVLVGLITAIAQSPVLTAQALSYDDDEFLTANPLVQNPSLDSATRFATEVLEPSTVRGYYAPLTMLSLMADYALGGRPNDLGAFHRTNLILHVLTVMVLVWLIYALTGHLVSAVLMGLLFGVHPLVVEPLAWIAERKTLLATFFGLASLLAYVRYAAGAARAFWISGLAFILACLAKPTAVVLPALMLALDVWPLARLELWPFARINRAVLFEKLAFFAVAIFFAAITLISHQRTVGLEVANGGLLTRLLTATHLVIFYLGKVVWPSNLTSVYLLPDPISFSSPEIVVSFVSFVVLSLGLLWLARAGFLAPLVGVGIFILGLAPTLGGLRYSWVTASDKYVYLPAIGLVLTCAWGLSLLWEYPGPQRKVLRICASLIIALLFVAEIGTSRAQLARWQTTETLYRHMLTLTPDFPLIHLNLGEHLLQTGRVDEAVALFYRAIEIEPTYAKAHNNLGVVFWSSRQPKLALGHLKQAVAADPDLAKAHTNLGIAFNGLDRPADALSEFDKALAITPRDAQAHCGAALAAIFLDRPQAARSHYEKSLRIAPGCRLPPGALP